MDKILLWVILAVFTLSCQSKNGSKEKQTPSPFEKERAIFFANLKTPDEVAKLVHQSNLDFDAGLLNDPGQATRYASNGVKAAANLGIYLADLNYCIAYKQDTHVNALFAASYELSQSIGIQNRILDFLKNRYENNIAQDDSVKAFMNELFARTTGSLKGTVDENLMGIAMAAYEIENLHIVLGLIERHLNDSTSHEDSIHDIMPLYKIALDQQPRIEIIYDFLKAISDPLDPNRNPNFPYYANAFETLIRVFHKAEQETTSKSQRKGEFINKFSVKELSESVNAIRNEVISSP